MSLTNTIINAMNEQDNYNQGLNMQGIWIGGTLFVIGLISTVTAIVRSVGRRKESERNQARANSNMGNRASSNHQVNSSRLHRTDKPPPVNLELQVKFQNGAYVFESSYPAKIHCNGFPIGTTPVISHSPNLKGKITVAAAAGNRVFQYQIDFPMHNLVADTEIFLGVEIFSKELGSEIEVIPIQSHNPLEESSSETNKNGTKSDSTSKLQIIVEMKKEGHLTEEEFQQAKAKILQS